MNRNDDLHEELQSHLEMEIQQNLATGISPEEACLAALRGFGNLTSMKPLGC